MVFSQNRSSESDSFAFSGVVYFSSIPTGMNVAMLTQELQNFGPINRVYLVPKKTSRDKTQRQYSEGWVEFVKRKNARKAARTLNCLEVPGGKRKPWFGELWNVRFLSKVTWDDLFAMERQDEERRRIQKDRDIITAKKQARLFKNSIDSYKLEARLRASKKGRFKERNPLDLVALQKPTEEELRDRMARSSRTAPEGIEGFSALTDKDFMNNLFSGGA
ncbi:Pre-rRNA-processing protein ESF2 [Echinococcus granulosus]|uniref:Activator of basal transcription 1 n=1 Tax=Echinococcus granulosus TaxID=6210 RepID=U6IUU5_ECHGR|nr:Pre-rRNA-processing protein ESF2 [Echinococcus granulosus]EUB64884.1 Pre-rRNA-processing protein ESF2 [Echinococcus granulosus]CDS15583.1 RNA recognition motif RNP 1 [Echinococcus granulosus]